MKSEEFEASPSFDRLRTKAKSSPSCPEFIEGKGRTLGIER